MANVHANLSQLIVLMNLLLIYQPFVSPAAYKTRLNIQIPEISSDGEEEDTGNTPPATLKPKTTPDISPTDSSPDLSPGEDSDSSGSSPTKRTFAFDMPTYFRSVLDTQNTDYTERLVIKTRAPKTYKPLSGNAYKKAGIPIKILHATLTNAKEILGSKQAKALWLNDKKADPSLNNAYIQKTMFPAETRIIFLGDLHGSIHALIRTLEKLIDEQVLDEHLVIQGDVHFVFLGDLIDYGDYGADTAFTAFELLNRNPDRVYICRGNHEEEMQFNWKDKQPVDDSFFKELDMRYKQDEHVVNHNAAVIQRWYDSCEKIQKDRAAFVAQKKLELKAIEDEYTKPDQTAVETLKAQYDTLKTSIRTMLARLDNEATDQQIKADDEKAAAFNAPIKELKATIQQLFMQLPYALFIGIKDKPEQGHILCNHGGFEEAAMKTVEQLLTSNNECAALDKQAVEEKKFDDSQNFFSCNFNWGDISGLQTLTNAQRYVRTGGTIDIHCKTHTISEAKTIMQASVNPAGKIIAQIRGHADAYNSLKLSLPGIHYPIYPLAIKNKLIAQTFGIKAFYQDEGWTELERFNDQQTEFMNAFKTGSFTVQQLIDAAGIAIITCSNARTSKVFSDEGYVDFTLQSELPKSIIKPYVFSGRGTQYFEKIYGDAFVEVP